MNAKNIVAVMLSATVCAFILTVVAGIVFHGAETTAENSKVREAILLLVSNLLGVVSGWLLGKDKEPPKQ